MTKREKAYKYLERAAGADRCIDALHSVLKCEDERWKHIARIIQYSGIKPRRELENTIERLITQFKEEREDVARTIGKIKNDKYRALLDYRYLQNMKLEDTANAMCYSMNHIQRLEGQAADLIAEMLGIEDD